MDFKFDTKTGFMCSTDSYENSKIILYGAPMDFTVSFKPGTRMGPIKIREVSYALEEYSIYLSDSLTNKIYYDAGDLEMPLGNVNESLKIIYEATKSILDDHKTPFLIGGEHLVSLPAIKATSEKYNDLIVIQFDAHADLRDEYSGEKYSHATVMRRAAEIVNPQNIYQLGIRSGTDEEINFAKKHTNFYPLTFKEELSDIIESIGKKPIYLTIDIDVIDPAFAPGTGTPEPGGCTSFEMIDTIIKLGSLNIVGMDLVEVLPYFDLSDRTALLAAKIIREILIIKG
ncbi:MAG TPA: agmatinase [Thermoanaerobacterales bacterium]|nr:agmatinase [Thermoanaerobacterales bacterium]